MAIEFTEANKAVQWNSVGAGGATLRNMRLVVYLGTPGNFNEAFFTGDGTELTALYLNYNGAYDTGKFEFTIAFSGASGAWDTTNDVLVAGYNEIFITYDGSSTANNPVFYVNGVSVAVTRRVAPTGTIRTSSTFNVTLGSAGTRAFNGTVYAAQYFIGRIFSADEVAAIYASRMSIASWAGLAFCPNLDGPAGGLVDGDTIGAGNTFRDIISGVIGTPSGSPVFKVNNLLSLGGE